MKDNKYFKMKIILIEDEGVALRKMKKMLLDIDSSFEIVAELESVHDAKDWFAEHDSSNIDLIFSDIQLSDGLSFDIFENVKTLVPIIFTTAYDEYALKAFKVNGVDYLLKPIQREELEASITNFNSRKKVYSQTQFIDIQQLIGNYRLAAKPNISFLCYQKDKLIPIQSETVSFFYTSNQIVYAVVENEKYVLSDTLEEIESRLSMTLFFRANRQFIIQKKAVANAEIYFNNRLVIHLKVKTPELIIISREKVSVFKNWLMGEDLN